MKTDRARKIVSEVFDEIKAPRNMVLGGIAAIFLLISIVLDYEKRILEFRFNGNIEDLEQINPWYFDFYTWSSFTKEIGFAFFIAMVIIIFVDRRSRKELEDMTEESIRLTSENVFKATLGVTVPDSIVRQTMGTIFSSQIVRHDLRLTFTLDELKDELRDWCEKCVLLRVDTVYELENISGSVANFVVKGFHAMPPYPDDALYKVSRIDSLSIGNETYDAEEINKGLKSSTQFRSEYEWPCKIEASQKVRVAVSYTAIRELSDAELWTSMLASTSLEVIVDMRIKGLLWDLGNRLSGILQPQSASRSGPYGNEKITFRSEEALLPHQGVLFWWRPQRSAQTESDSSDRGVPQIEVASRGRADSS